MARPKLPKTLEIADGLHPVDVHEVAMAQTPYPGWTIEKQARAGHRGRVHDLALTKLEKAIRKGGKKIDPLLLTKVVSALDPDRNLAKGGLGGGGLTVQILIVEE